VLLAADEKIIIIVYMTLVQSFIQNVKKKLEQHF